MQIRSVNYDDHSFPATVTFEMTTDEAALIYSFFGYVAPGRISRLTGQDRWGIALDEVASALAQFFNTHWDNGSDDVCPPGLRVDTLLGEG